LLFFHLKPDLTFSAAAATVAAMNQLIRHPQGSEVAEVTNMISEKM